jgi:hypothetical protein
MALLYRRDEEVVDHMGNPVSGVTCYLCQQPANVNLVPPSPLVPVYADPNGTQPFTSAPQTDAYGRCAYYAPPGKYTVVYHSPQIAGQTFALTDQLIVAPATQFVNDSTADQSITPSPNGIATGFTLSGSPNPPASLVLMLNGLVVPAYAFSGSQVVFETPPRPGDIVTATYQV